MYSLLLAVIYMAFISLGLPDSLLGAGWPVMQTELGVPLSYAGIISMIVSGGTIVSSLMSDFLTKKLGTGLVTALSVCLTAFALFGFSAAPSFALLCLYAIPYGFGAGAVDAALNNYVALHYSSRHMSWLHAFWGVGVSVSPYIMSICLSNQLGWKMGYGCVSIIQLALTAIIFLSLPLWKNSKTDTDKKSAAGTTIAGALKIKGVPFCLAAFFGFCAFEATAGMWASSYMAGAKSADSETAASFAALFYIGEMTGRFLNGFIADRFGDKNMIRIGIWLMLAGTVVLLLPFNSDTPTFIGLIVIGLGAAPVYPCIIHSTPANFGAENSQALIGIQMASAYCGSTFMPPLFGIIAEYTSLEAYPIFLTVFAVLMLVMTHFMYKRLGKQKKSLLFIKNMIK